MADSAPMPMQQRFWNRWNASTREKAIDEVSLRQAQVVIEWLSARDRTDLEILEVGCGACWLAPHLKRFGRVTATDLSDEVLKRARRRIPQVEFIAGDFMALELEAAAFDVVVSLEVLSHVADQPAFLRKIGGHLRADGTLMLATQNKPVLERFNSLPPPSPGQLRRWVDRNELKALLEAEFDVETLFSVTPRANRGLLRFVNARSVNWPVRAVVGDRAERAKEAMWLGWTLMARARKRG